MTNAIRIMNDEHWHELRAGVIGSSDIASLFGLSMYKSKFTLWHEKAGSFKKEVSGNRVDAGNYLEDAIAKMVSDKLGIPFARCNMFYQRGLLGATPDYQSNVAALEIKNMDYMMFKQKCPNGIPSRQFIFQLQHQLHCMEYHKGILAIFIGGNDLRLFFYDYRPLIGELMEKKAAEFFKSITDNASPSIDDYADLEVVKAVCTHENKHIDIKDNETASLCHDLKDATEKRIHFEKIEKLSKAKILHKMDGYNTATIGNFNVRLTKSADNEGTIINQDMVGNIINARKGAIRLSLKEINND